MNFEKKSSSVLESSCSIARLVYRCAVHQQKEIKKKKKKKKKKKTLNYPFNKTFENNIITNKQLFPTA